MVPENSAATHSSEVQPKMGITIHFAFIRRAAPSTLLTQVAAKARRLGMQVEHRSPNHLLIDPHPHSECIDLHWRQWKTLKEDCADGDDADERRWAREVIEHYCPRLVHDEDWVCLGFTKTQFAGWECHCAVAELLRMVGSYCRLSDVGDEGDDYESGSAGQERIKRAFDDSNKAISELAGQLKAQFGVDNIICGQDLEGIDR